ncbi:H+-ATPase G subunit [Jaminaea rosea]|uniref:V-type proton ATPase subunit G n=1 Tax=Jaminaea rosea TaxID=1569628 RepID=A0A316URM5_9BASI|nr:H+-ATPase G subunit [Jaminaea rosea]PWN26971.1 H+-ATPase G subunit [Jaminaea rosea]
MAAQQSQGIQTLLEAEKEAAKIVQKARNCESLPFPQCPLRDSPDLIIRLTPSILLLVLLPHRTQKLKDARSEAAKDIEELKASKDQEYQKYKKEHESEQSTSSSAVEKETDAELKRIEESYKKNRDDVVQKLLDRVVQVKAEMHRNAVKVE